MSQKKDRFKAKMLGPLGHADKSIVTYDAKLDEVEAYLLEMAVDTADSMRAHLLPDWVRIRFAELRDKRDKEVRR